MQKLDRANAIHWVDITKDKQALTDSGISYQQAMARVHVQDENQRMQTATTPENKERHFIVTQVFTDEDEKITGLKIEAVLNNKCYEIDWQELKDTKNWLMGWQ
ncbi:hypothetical protein GQR58_023614 [Nymphon striatum]|nr:hypothetical protein GQR58_023614 [Nymphon striatum]